MDDEQLARLLAKQEELGFAGTTLSCLDGYGVGDGSGHPPPAHPRGLEKEPKKSEKSYAGASGLAAALDDFDLMDWNRASLHPSMAGGTPPLPLACQIPS